MLTNSSQRDGNASPTASALRAAFASASGAYMTAITKIMAKANDRYDSCIS